MYMYSSLFKSQTPAILRGQVYFFGLPNNALSVIVVEGIHPSVSRLVVLRTRDSDIVLKNAL